MWRVEVLVPLLALALSFAPALAQQPADALAAFGPSAAATLAAAGGGAVAYGQASSPLAAVGAQFASPAQRLSASLGGGAFRTLTAAAATVPLPTGSGARSLAAWVKCDAPAGGAASAGRALLDLYDGTSAASSEHFTLLGATALAGGPAPAVAKSQYTLSSVAGQNNCSGVVSDGPVSTAGLGTPYGTIVDQFGNVVFVDRSFNKIRILWNAGPLAGNVTTIAGSGSSSGNDGVGLAATFSNPFAAVFDAAFANLYVADYKSNKIRKINIATSTVTTVVGTGTAGYLDGPALSAKITRFTI